MWAGILHPGKRNQKETTVNLKNFLLSFSLGLSGLAIANNPVERAFENPCGTTQTCAEPESNKRLELLEKYPSISETSSRPENKKFSVRS